MSLSSYARQIFFLLFLLAGSAMLATSAAASNDFLPVDQAFSYDVATNDDDTLTITWEIAPDYYLYRKQFGFEGEAQQVADVTFPDGETIEDEFFGKSEVYYDQVAVTVDPGQVQQLNLTWQGCAEAGLCYPPERATLDLAEYTGSSGLASSGSPDIQNASTPGSTPTDAGEDNASSAAESQAGSAELGEDQTLAASLAEGNAIWVLAVFFGLGLLLVFTPCVLPMVPILTSLIVGSGARGKRGFMLSVAYVLPMAITYALLGVVAALAGANLQAIMQTPWVLGAFALVFIALAASMFGLYEIQLPAGLRNRLDRANSRQRGGSLGGAAVMGVLSALLVGPCMTAPLAGALLYIADSGDVVLGGSALFTLGLGMGAPLILAGTVGARLLPKPGGWMTGVKVVFGFVLLGTAIWFVERVVPASVTLGLWGAWVLAIGVTLYQFAVHTAAPTAPSRMISRIAGLILSLWGGLLVIGAAGGADSLSQPLGFVSTPGNGAAAAGASQGDFMDRFEETADLDMLKAQVDTATTNGQWTLVDFYADWCISCKVIEEEVFGNAEVQQALGDFQLLRPDVTENDADDRELMQAFNIIGPPTLLLIGPDGEERRAARIVGELGPDEFLQRLSQAQGS
ncbi:protein-disulfide reductase DsbD [Halomonas piscis]|uniref:Thiol:disulfide interchange protein DsbD n=1 Tax=Halomonas piscis TaxID=3031727 RepID=A0ABY9Z2D2_9GAMM|nr:protein-disulfide reductase DsbD [Halomonas piscis]WNK20855.1 protein-disulfide reductase DsbD [Halomonas piscis]